MGGSREDPCFDPQLCPHPALLCLSFPWRCQSRIPNLLWDGEGRGTAPSPDSPCLAPHMPLWMSPVPHGHRTGSGAGSDPAELSIPRAAGARWDLFPKILSFH